MGAPIAGSNSYLSRIRLTVRLTGFCAFVPFRKTFKKRIRRSQLACRFNPTICNKSPGHQRNGNSPGPPCMCPADTSRPSCYTDSGRRVYETTYDPSQTRRFVRSPGWIGGMSHFHSGAGAKGVALSRSVRPGSRQDVLGACCQGPSKPRCKRSSLPAPVQSWPSSSR